VPLAPPDARPDPPSAEAGVLRADAERLSLPRDFAEDDERPWWVPGPVLVTVVALAIAFLLFVAWRIDTRSVFKPGEGWRVEIEGDARR
jgi:hypothetical protein